MVARYAGTPNRVGCGFGVFFVYLYTTFYGFCLDVTCYVYCAEIFPTYMRPTGMAVSIVSYFAPALRKPSFFGALLRQKSGTSLTTLSACSLCGSRPNGIQYDWMEVLSNFYSGPSVRPAGYLVLLP